MTAAERQRRHQERVQREDDTDVDLIGMANLFPGRTGLPMTV